MNKLIRLLAEEVMELVDVQEYEGYGKCHVIATEPSTKATIFFAPLTDWNDTMELVERVIGRLGAIKMNHEFEYWQVVISIPGKSFVHKDELLKTAICLAIAKARGIDVE